MSGPNPRCPNHPENGVIGSCRACGGKFCRLCLTRVEDESYCPAHRAAAMRQALDRSAHRPLPEPETAWRSPKRWSVAVWLAAVGGLLGAHCLYLGHYVSGVLRLAMTGAAVWLAGRLSFFAECGWWTVPAAIVAVAAAAGLVEVFFSIVGPGFLNRRMSGTAGGHGRGFFFGVGQRGVSTAREPFAPTSKVAYLLLFFLFGLYSLAALGGRPIDWNFPFALAAAILSGVWWCKDLLRLYWNDLTDGQGGVLS